MSKRAGAMKGFLCKSCTVEHYQFGENCDDMVCHICGNTDWSPRQGPKAKALLPEFIREVIAAKEEGRL